MNGKGNQTSLTGSPLSDKISDNSFKEQDKLLPIANVGRIMKKSLPANAKISKEAKETVQECVSEFISFITGEASDKCQREKRKTINGDDLLWAMTTLGFDNYVGPLKIYLNKFREIEDHHHNQSPTNTSSNNHVDHEFNKFPNNSISDKVDFQDLNGGFYSVGGLVTPKGYEESGRVIDYGDNFFTNRAMASAHLHHGSLG